MHLLNRRRIASVLIGLAAAAAALWIYLSRAAPSRHAAPAPVPIQDGKTIDFSSGSPVVKDSAADKASLDRTVQEMDAASRTVTFSAAPTPTPAK
jgi:hypothetical protein